MIDTSLCNRCRGARQTFKTYWYRLWELSVMLTYACTGSAAPGSWVGAQGGRPTRSYIHIAGAHRYIQRAGVARAIAGDLEGFEQQGSGAVEHQHCKAGTDTALGEPGSVQALKSMMEVEASDAVGDSRRHRDQRA